MKRTVTKQRRFGPGEFASLAKQCVDVIMNGQSVLDFLANKGVEDPQNEWYDIRRWIKSNDPTMYAKIPMNLRLELPVQRVNTKAETKVTKETSPETEVTSQTEAETPPAEPKRRPGRPPRTKVEEEPAQEKKTRKAPQKAAAKVVINEVQGKKLIYTRQESGQVRLHIPGTEAKITLTIAEMQTVREELAEVIKILGK